MKRLFFAVCMMALFATSCSSDDNDSNAEATTIMIDNVPFNQSGAVAPFFNATTSLQESSGSKTRMFSLASLSTDVSNSEQIGLFISYPSSQSSINGTYDVDSFEDMSADGSYIKGQQGYFFDEGTVTVTDLGDNKYKLQFNNVIAVDDEETLPSKTFTGSYEGVFTTQ